jgi:hypothetical protein
VEKKTGHLEDFCHLSDDVSARLSHVERLTLQGGRELEKFFSRLALDALPLNFAPLIAGLHNESLEATARFFDSCTEPFIAPQGVFAPKIIPVHGLSNEGEIVDIAFESAYQPLHESNKKIQVAIPENKQIRVRLWRHAQDAHRPTLIAVPGWTMGDPKITALMFIPGFFFRLGFNVAIFELPFHGRRLASEFRDVGHSVFPSANLYLTNEAILQAISDLRQLKLILRALGMKQCGALGISLGAYLTTVWSTIEPLHFMVNLLPFFDISAVAWAGLLREGNTSVDRTLLERAVAVHSPLRRRPLMQTADAQFIAMDSDSIIPEGDLDVGRRLFAGANFVKLPGDHEIGSSRQHVVLAMTAHLMRYLVNR